MYLIILIILLLIYSIWRLGTRNFGYWKEKGVKHIELVFLFGNMYKQFTQKLSLSQQTSFPEEKYVGGHMANDLGLVLRDLSVTGAGTYDMKDLMSRYTIDFIGACGFGFDFDSLNDKSSKFQWLEKRIVQITTRDALAHIVKRIAPTVFKHMRYFAAEIEEDIVHIVQQILNNRNSVPSGRNDFIDLLLEIKQKGSIVGESMEHFNPDGTGKTVEVEMDYNNMTAVLLFSFFSAGSETSSAASSFLLHELAFNPEIQEQCHNEIDKVLYRHSGRISYEAIKEMKLLKMAFQLD